MSIVPATTLTFLIYFTLAFLFLSGQTIHFIYLSVILLESKLHAIRGFLCFVLRPVPEVWYVLNKYLLDVGIYHSGVVDKESIGSLWLLSKITPAE